MLSYMILIFVSILSFPASKQQKKSGSNFAMLKESSSIFTSNTKQI